MACGSLDELRAALDQCTVVQLAALRRDWERWWARPKQLVPDTKWRSFGLLTGRGFGKTRTLAEYVSAEAISGRARRIALIAQNEVKTREVLVEGESGLLAVAPRRDRPKFESMTLKWPSGARAFVYTPESAGALRGPEHDLAWCSEIATWPQASMDEAFSNLRLGLRLGEGRLVWDSTPRRRHRLIRYLLERCADRPDLHIVVRGSTRENELNLTADAIDEWEREYGGTQRGREELEGEFLDDDDKALFKQVWIDRARRRMPAKLTRRILSIDPAISTRKGCDSTGLVELGLGEDGQVYVISDMTGKMGWEVWGDRALESYTNGFCDCIVAEVNRGGNAILANLRARGAAMGLTVVAVANDAVTRYSPKTIYVKESISRTSKGSRAEPVASLFEAGKVSMVIHADTQNLEEWMVTWEPGAGSESPDALDAMVQGVWELTNIGRTSLDKRTAFVGIGALAKGIEVSQRSVGARSLMPLVGRGRGDRL